MVQIKKKVTIRTKHEQVEPEISSPIPVSEPKNNIIGKYAIAGVAIAILAVGVYFIFGDNSKEVPVNELQTEIVEQVPIVETTPKGSNEITEGSLEQDEELDVSEKAVAKSPKDNAKEQVPKKEKAAPKNVPIEPSTSTTIPLSETLEQKAKEVIRGNYGNGIERKQKLGDQYAEIQSKVNEMYKNGLID